MRNGLRRVVLLFVSFFVLAATASAAGLTLEDITRGVYGAKTIRGVRPMQDGERYSSLVDGRRIVAY